MDAQRWSGEDPPMLDTLASYALTALCDPHGLPQEEFDKVKSTLKPSVNAGLVEYASDRQDDIIGLLNPTEETTETFARSLTVLGRHIADRLDRMQNLVLDDGEEVWGEAIRATDLALDALDEAIAALTPEES